MKKILINLMELTFGILAMTFIMMIMYLFMERMMFGGSVHIVKDTSGLPDFLKWLF